MSYTSAIDVAIKFSLRALLGLVLWFQVSEPNSLLRTSLNEMFSGDKTEEYSAYYDDGMTAPSKDIVVGKVVKEFSKTVEMLPANFVAVKAEQVDQVMYDSQNNAIAGPGVAPGIIYTDAHGTSYLKTGPICYVANNPGNIKNPTAWHPDEKIGAGKYLGAYERKNPDGSYSYFSIFNNAASGAEMHAKHITEFRPKSSNNPDNKKYGEMTIAEAINVWCPHGDEHGDHNDSNGYVKFVCDNSGLDEYQIVGNLNEKELSLLLYWMSRREGWPSGLRNAHENQGHVYLVA